MEGNNYDFWFFLNVIANLCQLESYEMNKNQIDSLIEQYVKDNDGLPNLEMIVYGHAHLLFTKYLCKKKCM